MVGAVEFPECFLEKMFLAFTLKGNKCPRIKP